MDHKGHRPNRSASWVKPSGFSPIGCRIGFYGPPRGRRERAGPQTGDRLPPGLGTVDGSEDAAQDAQ